MKTTFLIIFHCFTLSFYAQTFSCGDTLVDTRDGKKYSTVQIGSQCWMKENLNYGKKVTSYTSTVTHSDMSNNSISEKYAYNNDSTQLPVYGALYEWSELMNYATGEGAQGLCPNGWHIPTDAEWQSMIAATGGTLITANGGFGGNALKNIGEGFAGGAGTNTSGFSAKHSGDRDAFGIFYGLTLRSIFWTSTQTTPADAYHYTLWANNDTIERLSVQKITGFACRCVKNTTSGVNEIQNQTNLNLYPNPANTSFEIAFQTCYKTVKYTITNMTGQKIKHGTISDAKSLTISTVDLPEGYYLITLFLDGKKFDKKLVVLHD